MKKVSVVVPMYYEEEVVDVCYKELKKVLTNLKKYEHEIIFINDGSKDKTLELLEKIAKKDETVKIISFSRNFGHQAAVSAGLKYTSGDAIIIIDADLQDPPSLIPDMLELWNKGYEVVYGKRKHRDGESFFKLFTAKLFYKILNKLSSVSIPRDTGDFRLIDKKVAAAINSLPEHNKFLRGLYSFVGFKQTELLYERKARFAGQTKYSMKKMIKLASDGIIGFSYKPLTFILSLSFFFLLIMIASIVCLIIWPKLYLLFTIILVTSLCTSTILLAIWLLAVYMSRIYDEVKNRPSYIIDKTINIK